MILTATLPLLLAAATFTPTPTTRLESAPGQVRFEAGVLSQPSTQKLEDAARAYVAGRRDLALPTTSSLGAAKIFGTRFGASVHLPQIISGVLVDGASVVVTFDNNKRVVQLSSNLLPYRSLTTFSIAPQTALDNAGRGVEAALVKADGHFYGTWNKRYFVVGDEARAGYLVFNPTIFPNENWHAAVDAVTGKILFKQNRVFNAANDANVYARDPGGLDAGVGVTPTVPVALPYLRADAGNTLSGDRIVAYGCCTSAGCDGGAPLTISGTINVQGFDVKYDAGICERTQRASSDPLVHGTGDFVYTPYDPPNPICAGQSCTTRPGDLADEDEFAEVNAYHHVNAVYDFARELSQNAGPLLGETIATFDLRDVTAGNQTAVWTNITIPNQAELRANFNLFSGTTYSSTLTHMDNAAFVPREQGQGSGALLPAEYSFTTDAFMLFQGQKADYAYDAPVIWHEFAHGMLNTVPGLSFANVTFDNRSANNETGAIHEGMADWLAAAFGQNPRVGDYIGPRGPAAAGGSTLRSADNQFKCPEVLWGEVHQDGMHLTGSIWEARRELFQGTDQGRTFDAVVYAALASLPSNAGFNDLANAVATRVQTAFPNVLDAQAKARAIFDNRGITNCSKVLDITAAPAPQRDVFIIADRATAGLPTGQYVPGPFQFKISVPNGARSVSLSVPPGQTITGAAANHPIRLLAKDEVITFSKTSTSVTHNATASAASALSGNQVNATVNLDVPCGGEVYLAVTASEGTQLQRLSFTVDSAGSCAAPDAGTGGQDAGTGRPDAGNAVVIPAVGTDGTGDGSGGGAAVAGCGCNGGGSALSLFAFAGLLLLRRRKA